MYKNPKKYVCSSPVTCFRRFCKMSADRAYRRSLRDSQVLIFLVERVNRVLLRLSKRVSNAQDNFQLDQLLLLCQQLSPTPCDVHPTFTLYIDKFLGGIVLYFWLVVEGELWLKKILKKSLKVKLLVIMLQKCCFDAANIFFGIFVHRRTCLFS